MTQSAIPSLAVAAVLLGASPLAAADTFTVPGDFPTIQVAINNAASGDEIVVGPGTYFESVDLLGKTLVLRSSAGAASTIIDAIGQLRPAIRCVSGEGTGTTIQGFTVRNGRADGTFGDTVGGGLRLNNGADVLVRDCVFEGNFASNAGGGIYGNASTLTVESTIVTSNEAEVWGGGLYLNNSTGTLIDVEIVDNFAVTQAGGMRQVNGQLTMRRTLVQNNLALDGSGGLQIAGGSVLLEASRFVGNAGVSGGIGIAGSADVEMRNLLLQDNQATGAGGGIAVFGTSDVTIRNATLHGNQAGAPGGAIFTDDSDTDATTRVLNSIVWANVPDGIAGFTTESAFNLLQSDGGDAPGFVDEAGDDFRLAAGSRAIDAGDSARVPADLSVDLIGERRVVETLAAPSGLPVFGLVVDQGAFEFQPAITDDCPQDITGDGMIDIADLNALLAVFGDDCD